MLFVALALIAATAFVGCSSFTEEQIQKGVKAYKKDMDYEKALEHFQNVLDTQPQLLSRRKYAKEIDMYRDSQVLYGTAAAQRAKDDGDLRGAWALLVQTSMVDPERTECRIAGDQARQLRERIVQEALKEAKAALERGDAMGAVSWAAQSMWFGGGDEAAAVYQEAARPGEDVGLVHQAQLIRTIDVNGNLRTDSLERLVQGEVFAPYGTAAKGAVRYAYSDRTRAVEGTGIPVYFGDVPRYYSVVKPTRVDGAPVSQPVPVGFAKTARDSLRLLSRQVVTYSPTEEGGPAPNAIVNTRLWTKSKKAFTRADLVQVVEFDDPDAGVPEAVTWIDAEAEPAAPAPAAPEESLDAGDGTP